MNVIYATKLQSRLGSMSERKMQNMLLIDMEGIFICNVFTNRERSYCIYLLHVLVLYTFWFLSPHSSVLGVSYTDNTH